ncbi:MAG: sucrose-6-phosphate hydrolase [Clostridium sp.]|nr:sucrose-6-phosphate hydrolase [Clostridium sp.]
MDEREKLTEKINSVVGEAKLKCHSDYYRQKYHITPPVGFLNDPNGFIEFKEEYHLFYQFNPFYPKDKKVCWAHLKSRNLVDWESMPVALMPLNWYETHGCYSGSAVNNNGVFTIMYTGNVKDSQNNRHTYQCIAESKDGINFEKYEKNPVINGNPEEYTAHFRDPKVIKVDNKWYAVIGAQSKNEKGAAVLYSSEDIYNWNKVGEIESSEKDELKFLGYMWECPNLFNINGQDILMFCPQGVKAEGDLYNNIYQCGYFIGKMDYASGKFIHNDFIELDSGFEFYAPQITLDSKGRTILIGWMGLPEQEDSPTVKNNWIHCMTIPRELSLKGDKLIQKPVSEMGELRREKITYNDLRVDNEEVTLSKIHGDSYEMICDFTNIDAQQFGLKLRSSKLNDESTLLYYDVSSKKVILDRDKSGVCKTGVRRRKVEIDKKLKLHIFMDKSSIEVFINDGEETFTSRIYPRKENQDIIIFSKQGSISLNIDFWGI